MLGCYWKRCVVSDWCEQQVCERQQTRLVTGLLIVRACKLICVAAAACGGDAAAAGQQRWAAGVDNKQIGQRVCRWGYAAG
jgi:hypothetical protein